MPPSCEVKAAKPARGFLHAPKLLDGLVFRGSFWQLRVLIEYQYNLSTGKADSPLVLLPRTPPFEVLTLKYTFDY